MKTKLFMLGLSFWLLVSCSTIRLLPKDASGANLPNPAATYCEEQGYEYEMRTEADGSQSGVCIFTDGSQCDDWAYYRGECSPGDNSGIPEPVVSPTTPEPSSDTPGAYLPNPAATYCEEQGYEYEIRTEADGSQSGVCIFTDGSQCDGWAYYRGECSPGDNSGIPGSGESPSDEGRDVGDGWKIYRNQKLGYHFHYPANTKIVENDEPSKSISIEGPVVDGETWPLITISHPSDHEDYLPPGNVDLEVWLIDHNMLGDGRRPDVIIAGTTAIHLRHDRTPQSYAYDRYFFVKSGQLYMILIGHSGDKEDWDLYNHFLQSLQFDR
jgi:putative hemolysin